MGPGEQDLMEWHLSNPRKTQEILDFLMLSRSSQGLSCTHRIPFLLLEVRMHRAAAGSLFPPPGVEGGLSKPLISLCLKPPLSTEPVTPNFLKG